ncbi:MAG: hypothetical protein ABJA83_12315 [Burkholderiaceae bacterium]
MNRSAVLASGIASGRASRALCALGLAFSVGASVAQTPAQMEYERQQREYWRQQEQQRQEQQRVQQIQQENARRQQEESNRINRPSGQSSGTAPPMSAPQGRSGDATGAQAASAARAMWEKRPALPADRNPLLGSKWMRPASTRSNSSDPFAAIQAMAKGGLCDVLFGGGVFEFRADRLVGMDARTTEQELDRVEYRGDAKHVVVLPKTTFKLMEFDIESPDRINWASQKCVLVRAGAAQSPSAPTTSARRK